MIDKPSLPINKMTETNKIRTLNDNDVSAGGAGEAPIEPDRHMFRNETKYLQREVSHAREGPSYNAIGDRIQIRHREQDEGIAPRYNGVHTSLPQPQRRTDSATLRRRLERRRSQERRRRNDFKDALEQLYRVLLSHDHIFLKEATARENRLAARRIHIEGDDEGRPEDEERGVFNQVEKINQAAHTITRLAKENKSLREAILDLKNGREPAGTSLAMNSISSSSPSPPSESEAHTVVYHQGIGPISDRQDARKMTPNRREWSERTVPTNGNERTEQPSQSQLLGLSQILPTLQEPWLLGAVRPVLPRNPLTEEESDTATPEEIRRLLLSGMPVARYPPSLLGAAATGLLVPPIPRQGHQALGLQSMLQGLAPHDTPASANEEYVRNIQKVLMNNLGRPMPVGSSDPHSSRHTRQRQNDDDDDDDDE